MTSEAPPPGPPPTEPPKPPLTVTDKPLPSPVKTAAQRLVSTVLRRPAPAPPLVVDTGAMTAVVPPGGEVTGKVVEPPKPRLPIERSARPSVPASVPVSAEMVRTSPTQTRVAVEHGKDLGPQDLTITFRDGGPVVQVGEGLQIADVTRGLFRGAKAFLVKNGVLSVTVPLEGGRKVNVRISPDVLNQIRHWEDMVRWAQRGLVGAGIGGLGVAIVVVPELRGLLQQMIPPPGVEAAASVAPEVSQPVIDAVSALTNTPPDLVKPVIETSTQVLSTALSEQAKIPLEAAAQVTETVTPTVQLFTEKAAQQGDTLWGFAKDIVQRVRPDLVGDAANQAINALKNEVLARMGWVGTGPSGEHPLSIGQKIQMLSDYASRTIVDCFAHRVSTVAPPDVTQACALAQELGNPPPGLDPASNPDLMQRAATLLNLVKGFIVR